MPDSAASFDQALQGESTWAAALGIPDGILEVYAVLGSQYYEQGLVEDARAMFNAVITLDNRAHLGYAGMGAIDLRDGNLESALAYLEQAYARDASDLVVCGNLGEVLVLLGRQREAARYLRESAALDPDEMNTYANRARAVLSALPVE